MEDASGTKVWIFSTACVFAALVLGYIGFSFVGFGPCGPGDTTPLRFTGPVSVLSLVGGLRLLSPDQRAFRLRRVPFYLLFSFATLFTAMQLLFAIV